MSVGLGCGAVDWERLLAARESDRQDRSGWEHALAHRASCSRCREDSSRLDPTLIFSELPTLHVSDDEIEQMSAGVAEARRLSERLSRLPSDVATAPPRRRWSSELGLRFAAAAAVVVLSLVALSTSRFDWWPGAGSAQELAGLVEADGSGSSSSPAAGPAEEEATALEPLSSELAYVVSEHLARLPLVEHSDVRFQQTGGAVDWVWVEGGP